MEPEFWVKSKLLEEQGISEEEKDEQGILEDLKNRHRKNRHKRKMKINEIASKWDRTEEEIIKMQPIIKGGDINEANKTRGRIHTLTKGV